MAPHSVALLSEAVVVLRWAVEMVVKVVEVVVTMLTKKM
jgi:hypothetical protein